MTGHLRDTTSEECLAMGFRAALRKPPTIEVLATAVAQALGNGRKVFFPPLQAENRQIVPTQRQNY